MSVGIERLIQVGTALGAIVAVAITHGVLQLLPEVSFAAHCWMMIGVLVAVGLLGTGLWCETQPDGMGISAIGVLPLAVAAIWGGLWPAMTEWGAIGLAFPGQSPPVAWWASSTMKWVGLAAIMAGGYYWLYRRSFN
uniref:Uncharacterized protein n=1 Tax=Pseudomonas fluorescens TaxID=294 RepID=A0A220ITA3_PSEFL|nr:hypothetical protein [Pseudomonas fluorescens]ASI38088.1 Hypothetical protein [Pseudomonas fluorescens]AWH58685.1 Hypothetical protein [Pseudomonas fluorescens]